MKVPRSYSLGLLSALGLIMALAGASVSGRSQADSVEVHVAAARTAAGQPHQDGSKMKLAALEKRKPGDAHPYIIGNDSVKRYLTMVGECAKAGLLRLQ